MPFSILFLILNFYPKHCSTLPDLSDHIRFGIFNLISQLIIICAVPCSFFNMYFSCCNHQAKRFLFFQGWNQREKVSNFYTPTAMAILRSGDLNAGQSEGFFSKLSKSVPSTNSRIIRNHKNNKTSPLISFLFQ